MEERQFVNRAYLQSLLPVTLAVLLIQLCSVVNNLVVGKLIGSDGLAVMSVVSPIGFVFSTIGSLMAVGGSMQSAHSIGEQDFDGSNRSLYVSLKFLAVCGLILTAGILIFCEPLLSVLGVPDSIHNETKKYIIAFAPAAFGAMGIYIPFNYLKIHGAQKYAVYVSAVMAVVNIGLDFVFAKLLSMGMAGIGLATTIGYWISAIPGIFILYSKKGGFTKPKNKKSNGQIKKIFISGSPSALNNLCHLLRSYFMNLIIIAFLGKDGLSTFSIISTVFLFSVTISNGTSLSMAPFAAVFSSEKDNASLRQVFDIAMISAVVLMSAFVAAVEFFPVQICRMFSVADGKTLIVCAKALRIFAVSLVFNGINTILSTFYQSIKHAVSSNVFTALRSFAFVVAFAFLIVKTSNAENIWYAFILAEIITLAVTLAVSFVYGKLHPNISKLLMIDTYAEKKGKYIAFSVEKDNSRAAESAEKITQFCEQNNLSPKLTMAIGLAIEEILISFNDHALTDKDDKMRSNVRILIYEDIVILRFRTAGKPFDPIKYAENDDELGSDSMGIKLVQKLSQAVLYDRVFGLNNLTIIF